MIKREKIKEILSSTDFDRETTVMGWVKTFRNNQFIAINDGSCMSNLQVVVDFANTPDDILKKITTGAAISATGKLVESLGKGQNCEIKASSIQILGESDAEKFPKLSMLFLEFVTHFHLQSISFSTIKVSFICTLLL